MGSSVGACFELSLIRLHEPEPEPHEMVGAAPLGAACPGRRADRAVPGDQPQGLEGAEVLGQLPGLHPQAASDGWHVLRVARQRGEDGEVDRGFAQLGLQQGAGLVEQLGLPVDDPLGEYVGQRTPQGREVTGHSARDGVARHLLERIVEIHQLARVGEAQRPQGERDEPAVQGALLRLQSLHLGHGRAGQDELDLRLVTFLLDDRLDSGQVGLLLDVSGSEEIRELVDDHEGLAGAGEAVEHPNERGRVIDLRADPEHRLQLGGQVGQLLTGGDAVRDQNDRPFAMGEPPEQPALADPAPSVEVQRLRIPRGPPLLQSREFCGA